jgi:hypothetical protein
VHEVASYYRFEAKETSVGKWEWGDVQDLG